MRLFELTGYRDRPETATIKAALGPLEDGPNVEDRRYILQKFLEQAQERGFKSLGHGAFGAVLTHPGLNYAIKLFKNDAAYHSVVNYMLQNQSNPMLPKFRGKLCNLGDDFFFVRMELLNPALPATAIATVEVLEFYSAYPMGMLDACSDMLISNPGIITRRNQALSDETVVAEVKRLDASQAELQTITELRQLAADNRFRMDIKADNFMMRGNQLVLIDPIFDPRAVSLF